MAEGSLPAERLLIVDDVADNRAILARFFARRGFEIVEAESGLAALEMIAQQQFDAVLMDVVMPGMSGLDALRKIRESYSQSRLPVIMITALADPADTVRALDAGANDYITKPVILAIAYARVQTQLARLRAERERERNVQWLRRANEQLMSEIDERRRSQARAQYLADHDALTGLGNRRYFRERLSLALGAEAADARVSLLYLDVDGFKVVNDTLGHSAGDQLLVALAERLRDVAGQEDVVARIGGDEFAIVHPVADRNDCAELARKIIDRMARPFLLDGSRLSVGCCIGIATAPEDGSSYDLLLSRADLALYSAKREGRGRFQFFKDEMSARASDRRILELELRRAIGQGEFCLHYQPIVSCETGRISSFEALVRWQHPRRGLVYPAEFIELAEQTGLIEPLGRLILRQACAEAMMWPDNIKVAVNLSPVQLRGGLIVETVSEALQKSGLSSNRLELEITELALLNDTDQLRDDMRRLRRLGVRINMDDFGTGYSSLSYLRQYQFDKIKIDMSFVRDLPHDRASAAIVRSALAMAAGLDMQSVAEGVETERQAGYLKEHGCTELQGYLIGKPVAPALARELACDVGFRQQDVA